MNSDLQKELERLKLLFASVDRPFPEVEGVIDDALEQVHELTGIKLAGDILSFYKYMDGLPCMAGYIQ